MSLRLLAAAVLIAFLSADPASAGETKVVFEEGGLQKLGITPARRRTRNLTFEHTARRDVSGTPDLMNIETVTVVGGVIFVERARPSAAGLACPAVEIDLSRESGRRLRVEFAGERVSGTLYDWEIVPLAAFVKSGSDALFTYMGVHGEYHRSFAGNLAGFNLFLLDTFRSLRNPSRAHLVVETTIPGYTSNREVTEANEAAAHKLERWMRNSHLMFTDLDVDFVFQGGADGELVIDGDPYWIAVKSRTGGSGRISGRFDDSATTLAANPAVFGSGYRLARYAAFFRYLKADCPARWQTLQGSIAKAKRELDLYTIPLRGMPYAVR